MGKENGGKYKGEVLVHGFVPGGKTLGPWEKAVAECYPREAGAPLKGKPTALFSKAFLKQQLEPQDRLWEPRGLGTFFTPFRLGSCHLGLSVDYLVEREGNCSNAMWAALA